MKLKNILSLSLFYLCLNVNAQAVPTGQRLKDINPAILVGSVLQTGYADAKNILIANTPIQTVFNREFNLGQTTCYPAWSTWKGLKQYDFTPFNQTINWLASKHIPIVGHLLAGPDNYYPEWYKKASYTTTELDSILLDFIRTAITSNNNSEKVDYWNVVNESLWWNGHYYNSNSKDLGCKLQELGMEEDKSGLVGDAKIHISHPIYIRKAFEYARKFTKKKLELRDYNAEFWGSTKSKAFYQLVKHLLNSGTPLDAVGFQGHFDLAKTNDWSKFKQTIQEFKKLGLEVYITELDVADKTKSWSTELAENQKQQYKLIMQAIVEGGANWICFWGVRDNWNKSWLLNESPLLFDHNFNPKPAYYGVQQGLMPVNIKN
jgi:GH35 family endo-1,4-beta-xylanase